MRLTPIALARKLVACALLLLAGCATRPVEDMPPVEPAALPLLDGAGALDLAAVSHVDSAGLALLAELQERAGGRLALRGEPDGLPGLQAAYRLGAALQTA